MRNKIFAVVFFVFLFAIMISAPVKTILTNAGVIESKNVGNVIEVEKVYTEGTFGASFFNGIEEIKRDINDTYINYIPFYVDITSKAESLTQRLNKPISSFLLQWGNRIIFDSIEGESDLSDGTEYKTIYLKSNDKHRYYEIIAKTESSDQLVDFLIRVPSKDSSELFFTVQDQANLINDFAARRPDVNWYVFPVTCFEDTEICEKILPSESKHGLFNLFFNKLNPEVQYDYIKINDITDREKLYFKADHHWNVYGYTEGYRLITEMFKKNYPDIEMRTPKIYTFDDEVKVYGSNAIAVADYHLFNPFHVADFSLPKHYYVEETGVPYGGTESFEQSLERYLNKQHNTSNSYNHYVNFSPIVREVAYPENNTGRNLLIIGDSYSIPLLEVLASHFDKTYIRYIDANSELLDAQYEELIDECGITDVLMLEMSDRIIYDYYSDSLKGLN